MSRAISTWVLAIASFVTLTGQYARAQAANPYVRQPAGGYTKPPVLSPYLNLGRGGSPSANYFYGVVPFENRGYDNPSSPRATDLERRPGSNTELDEIIPTLWGTGHAAGFMTMSPYYGSSLGNFTATPRYNSSSPSTTR